jgi:aminoglycoside 6-adenylyltransferase
MSTDQTRGGPGTDDDPRGGSGDPALEALVRWAEGREDVRAMLLTSTRAVPGARLDAYSDYDVILVVRDVAALLDDPGWLTAFGEVLIAYWDPLVSDPVTGAEHAGNITNYVDGLKIDFSLWSVPHFASITAGPEPDPELDAGHRVLLDRDGLTAGLPAPTYRGYVPTRPDEPTFHRLITDFLIGVPYVAKYLLRDELLPAKWVLDFDMRFTYLVPLLQWRVECDHDWSLKAGNLGRGLKSQLPPEIWSALQATFAGASPEANWDALFDMITLFDRVARELAEILGHSYPERLVTGVTEHARQMRAGGFVTGRSTGLPSAG